MVLLSEVTNLVGIDNRRVYDWDEFSKIPGCTVGPHSCEQKTQSFAPSPTVAAINAAVNPGNTTTPTPASTPAPANSPVIKSIDEYNRSNPDAPTAVKSVEKLLAQKNQPTPMKGRFVDKK